VEIYLHIPHTLPWNCPWAQRQAATLVKEQGDRALLFSYWVRLSPLRTAATIGLFCQPQMIDDGDCGAIGGMKIGRGNRSTRRKPAPVPLCTPQIPHDLTWTRIQGAAVGRWRLTA
jgi:hypothetical protein